MSEHRYEDKNLAPHEHVYTDEGDHEHDPEYTHAENLSHEHGHTHSDHGHAHILDHSHEHGHHHDPKQRQAVIHRIARATGHLNAVKKMVEDDRDCSEVLIQLAAVQSALNSVSRIILKDHIEHCIVDAVEENDSEAIDRLNKAIDQMIK